MMQDAIQTRIEGLLQQMNEVLLDGGASLIVDRSWKYDFEGDDDSDFDELTDEILYTLYWHDGDPVEVEVRVGIDGEDAGYVKVEDEEIDEELVTDWIRQAAAQPGEYLF